MHSSACYTVAASDAPFVSTNPKEACFLFHPHSEMILNKNQDMCAHYDIFCLEMWSWKGPGSELEQKLYPRYCGEGKTLRGHNC